jgi:thiol-disulfide isomerase/thioredoxin
MIADPEKSQAYFASVGGAEESDDWPKGKIVSVRSKAELAAATAKGKVFVEYVAPWCGKCAMMAPTIAALSEARADVKFIKVDTTLDGLQTAAGDAGVHALPAFRFFKDGAQVGAEITGFKRAVVEEAMAKF